MADRGHLLTEQRNPRSTEIDALPLDRAFDVMNDEHADLPAAISAAKPQIIRAIELIHESLRSGGRLFYVGAGTSGRLGVLDASECPPTFLTDPEMVQGIIAGGDEALKRSIEKAEDDPDAGAKAVRDRDVGPRDVVFGIASGGTTPYVHGAIREARRLGARTVFFACVPPDQAGDEADVSIRVLTGPEVVTGSTRLKAGIATKMVLNIISTLTMVRMGKVFGNLMVDVDASRCDKLTDRATRIVMSACGLPRGAATALLERAGWHVKTAIVMNHRGVSPEQAIHMLEQAGGDLRRVLAGA